MKKNEIDEILIRAILNQKKKQKIYGCAFLLSILCLVVLAFLDVYLKSLIEETNAIYKSKAIVKTIFPLAQITFGISGVMFLSKSLLNRNNKQVKTLLTNPSSLAWLYIRIPLIFGLKISPSIQLFTNKNKRIIILASSLPKQIIIEEFIFEIQSCFNPHCLIGFTQENVSKFRTVLITNKTSS
jgi:hypothetical protein